MFYLFLVIPLLIVVFTIYTLFWFFNQYRGILEWVGLLIAMLPMAYFIYLTYRLLNRQIKIFNDKIWVKEDIGSRDVKLQQLQYQIDVLFDNISEIKMTITSNNSKNQYMRYVITPMPYIVLCLNNGKEVGINVYYYSKKQTIEIIDLIIEKKKLTNPDFINKSGLELVNELKKR